MCRNSFGIAGFLALAHYLRLHFVDRRMNRGEQIGVFGFSGDFMMTPGNLHLNLIQIVFMFEEHVSLSFSVGRVKQLSDLREFGFQFHGLRRSEAYVASGVCDFHLAFIPVPVFGAWTGFSDLRGTWRLSGG
jgi:hypothetical protein